MSERQLTIIQSFVKRYISSVKRHQSQDTNHKTPIAVSHDTCLMTPVARHQSRHLSQDSSYKTPVETQLYIKCLVTYTVIASGELGPTQQCWVHVTFTVITISWVTSQCPIPSVTYTVITANTIPSGQPCGVQVTLTLTNLNQDAQ